MSAGRGRIPSLDGLRAVSIVLVLVSHLVGSEGFPGTDSVLAQIDPGHLGVRVFFVISGYLISLLLFAEMERTGTVSLARFYLRRTFRIFPAFYAFVAVVAALAAAGWVALRPGDLAHAVTYTTNYHVDRAWPLGHLWSLAVEEQFYLLWPFVLLVLGRERGLRAAAAFVVLAPIVRVVSYVGHLGPVDGIGETFQTTGDSIAMGCLLAGWRDRLHASPGYTRLQRSPWFWTLGLVAIAAAVTRRHPLVDQLVGQTTANVCIACIVDRCVRFPTGPVGRVLDSRPLVFVGTLSYSIYLWQQVFLDPYAPAFATRFPQSLVFAGVVAWLSYRLVEQPMLRVRERVEARWFGGARRSPAGVPASPG